MERIDEIRGAAASANPMPRWIAVSVVAAAALVSTLSFGASQLWVAPDTSYYVELAGGIADRSDFRSELFLIRPPGYPLMLAAIFRLFGESSPAAILIVQHAMVVATAALAAAIAWRLTGNRAAATAAGLMSACSLQVVTYANLIMTEVPYTLALVGSVYCLVTFHQGRCLRRLAAASLLAGVGYLFRPIGMSVVGACVVAGLHRGWRERAAWGGGIPWRRLGPACTAAIAPALIVALPSMVQNQLIHGGDLSTRCANLALYFRIFQMDKLDSGRSEALADIRSVVAEASARGAIPRDADWRLWGPVWQSYQAVRGAGLAESSRIMGQAARDVIVENPVKFVDKSIRYSLWMVLVPDGFYRFHPDGAPGLTNAAGDSVRDSAAEIFSSSTYEPMLRRWIDPWKHYLPLRSEPTTLTPIWSGVARWFYRHVEKGPSILGFGDSPYEAFGWLCLFGIAGCVLLPNRATWMLVACVIGLQVVVSAVLGGPTPRYAVPVRPLLLLFPCVVALAPYRVIAALSARRTRPRRSASTPLPTPTACA